MGGHELVTLLFTLLPRWAVSASFRPLETLSFENAAPLALREPFLLLRCGRARRAARNNEELGSFALDFGPGGAALQICVQELGAAGLPQEVFSDFYTYLLSVWQ